MHASISNHHGSRGESARRGVRGRVGGPMFAEDALNASPSHPSPDRSHAGGSSDSCLSAAVLV